MNLLQHSSVFVELSAFSCSMQLIETVGLFFVTCNFLSSMRCLLFAGFSFNCALFSWSGARERCVRTNTGSLLGDVLRGHVFHNDQVFPLCCSG